MLWWFLGPTIQQEIKLRASVDFQKCLEIKMVGQMQTKRNCTTKNIRECKIQGLTEPLIQGQQFKIEAVLHKDMFKATKMLWVRRCRITSFSSLRHQETASNIWIIPLMQHKAQHISSQEMSGLQLVVQDTELWVVNKRPRATMHKLSNLAYINSFKSRLLITQIWRCHILFSLERILKQPKMLLKL